MFDDDSRDPDDYFDDEDSNGGNFGNNESVVGRGNFDGGMATTGSGAVEEKRNQDGSEDDNPKNNVNDEKSNDNSLDDDVSNRKDDGLVARTANEDDIHGEDFNEEDYDFYRDTSYRDGVLCDRPRINGFPCYDAHVENFDDSGFDDFEGKHYAWA